MQNNIVASQRNQSLELWKLIAAFFVVCIHCDFPGRMIIMLNAIARFAVPFFFAVSGFFSWHAKEARLRKRIISIAKLLVFSTVLYILFDIYCCRYVHGTDVMQNFREKLPLRSLFSFLLLNVHPIAGHLWYLNTVLCCYLAFYFFTKWAEGAPDYRPLYYINIPLFVIFLFLDSFCSSAHITVNSLLFRNALFFGFPMFTLGIFLREYSSKIFRLFPLTACKLWIAMAAGVFLALLQRYGTEKLELPIGMFIVMVAVLLLCIRTPQLTQNPLLSFLISKCGNLSTIIYVVHLIWLNLYHFYWQDSFRSLFGETAANLLSPVFAFFCSLLTGIVWLLLQACMTRLCSRKKAK